jgi:hypothetical protein
MPDPARGNKPLDLATLCLECAAVLIQLGLEPHEHAQLVLDENARFNDAFGRATAIWKPEDDLRFAGWWCSAAPRHAMVRNASRKRGSHYVRLCAKNVQGKLKRRLTA